MNSVPTGWPEENIAFPLRSLDLFMLPGPHPLHEAHGPEIDSNWQVESARNPHLFNGRMVLQRDMSIADGHIVGRAHEIPYSALLWWRKRPDPAGAFHLFGFAVPVSSDGAIIAIRMGPHTANAGQVYCAAGSLDLSDVVDGKLDLVSNMRREVLEETGLDLDEAVADPQFFATHAAHRIVVFRFFRFDLTAAEMLARITAHMPNDAEQEIAEALEIRSADRGLHSYNPMMFPILDLFFGAGR
jgi:8-oxo-dGTP pyrophosphatase MutT (NUDIX family)